MWLRDNCPTAHDQTQDIECLILNVSENISAKKLNINKEKLEVEWSEGIIQVITIHIG